MCPKIRWDGWKIFRWGNMLRIYMQATTLAKRSLGTNLQLAGEMQRRCHALPGMRSQIRKRRATASRWNLDGIGGEQHWDRTESQLWSALQGQHRRVCLTEAFAGTSRWRGGTLIIWSMASAPRAEGARGRARGAGTCDVRPVQVQPNHPDPATAAGGVWLNTRERAGSSPGSVSLFFKALFSSQNFASFFYCNTFVFIWQTLSNHGVTRLKRFISQISGKLYN